MDSYHFFDGVNVYFVTFTVSGWLPIFDNPKSFQILINSLRYCIEEKYLRVYAYVIMPTHIHMVVFDAQFDNYRLQKTLANFRKFTGHQLANYVDQDLSESFSSLIRNHNQIDRERMVWKRGWHAKGLVSEELLT